MKMARTSEHSETDIEDKYGSEFILPEDLDDEFIFQSHPQIHERTMVEHIIKPASEVPDTINQKNREDNILDSTRNLQPSGKIPIDWNLSPVKCLRLSDMQTQSSLLGRITRPFPRDNNDEMKPKKKEKKCNKYQIQAVLIENLQQFIQKTALPAIQKYEQLQRKYCNEKKKWTEKVEFLEWQNSILKSELQTADRSSAEEELNNFRQFSRENQISAEANLVYIPALNESREITAFNLDALPTTDVKPCLSSESECTGKKGEFIDFKLWNCTQVHDGELERIAALNESSICYEDFPNMKEKPYQADKLNLEGRLRQKSFQSRNIYRKPNN